MLLIMLCLENILSQTLLVYNKARKRKRKKGNCDLLESCDLPKKQIINHTIRMILIVLREVYCFYMETLDIVQNLLGKELILTKVFLLFCCYHFMTAGSYSFIYLYHLVVLITK